MAPHTQRASRNAVMSSSSAGVNPSSTSSVMSMGVPSQLQISVVPPASLEEPSLGSAVIDGGEVELDIVVPAEVDAPEVVVLDVEASPPSAETSTTGPHARSDAPTASRAHQRISAFVTARG